MSDHEFRLSAEALPEDLDRALRASAAGRGPFGDPVFYFASAPSTNDLAAALAERGAREGTMVVAQAQSAGRGRFGREWFSPPGAGLYVSLVCRDARAAPVLTLAAGVAVADGIRQATGLPVLLKWPNDVVVPDTLSPRRHRKIAGVLAEASTGAGALQHVILGFGVNVRPVPYPSGIAARATSLEAELGRAVDQGALLAAILIVLHQRLRQAARGRAAEVLDRWRALAPSAVGSPVEWRLGGTASRGTTAGIDDSGALLVNTGRAIERILAGDLTWL